MELLLLAIITAPIAYLQYRVSRAAIAYEKAQYDDRDCAPGFTNYPGPM